MLNNRPVPMKNIIFFAPVLALALAGPVFAQPSPASAGYTELKIIQTIDPHFPFRLQNSPVMDGEARVVVNVDQAGRLVDWLVTGYTRSEFADEAVRVLQRWKYEPAVFHGEKWNTVREVQFSFSRTGVVISTTSTEHIQNQMERMMPSQHAFRVFQLRELDRIPVPSRVVSPAYPESLAAAGVKGSVTVEFYIDVTGKVRMPAALEWPSDPLAELAVAAVEQWQFEPPLHAGRPVLVLARQEFKFLPKS